MSHELSIHFHGVRGSIAAPGISTARVGGNTSCVEVIAGDTRIVLDAGTGLRALGDRLISSGPSATTILLSHLHWDHIQGLPFFTPIYVPGNWVEVVTGANGVMPLEAALRRQMSAPFFPVDFEDVSRQLRVREPRLGEEPRGERVVRGLRRGVERLVGEVDEAVGAAAQPQVRRVEIHVLEAQFAGQQRPPRQRDLGALELEHRVAAPVGHLDAGDGEPRPQALPAGGDIAQRHGEARGAGHGGRDLLAPVVHAREHGVAQEHHRQQEQREHGHGEGGRGSGELAG